MNTTRPTSHRALVWFWFIFMASGASLSAQEMEPGAYSPSPIGFNVLLVADNFSTGDLAFDPSGPIDDASADINVTTAGYLRTFGAAGRLASVGLALPYVRGDLEGLYLGQQQNVHRAGWGDPRVRFTLNLHGVPAMSPKEFSTYKPTTIVGASLTVGLPLGKYDNTKLINIGGNRWAFKPELGVTRAIGSWTIEGAAGVWLFTDNTDFMQGGTREQDPIGSFQAHAIYTIRPRMWVALNTSFFTGGRTTINGTRNVDLQRNSRVGATLALPLNRQHSLKFQYSRGAMTTVGADFATFGVSYQYIWF